MWANSRPHFVHKSESGTISTHKSACLGVQKSHSLEVVSCPTDIGNNPMVGMTVACAVAVQEAMSK